MTARRVTLGLLTVGVAALLAACGSDDDGGGSSAAQSDFLSRCKVATDAACQKGFDCQNFFVTSKYNSVAHCQHDVHQGYIDAAGQMSGQQLTSCASACDLMKSDIDALTCDKFTDAVFNTYKC
ncbi:MAG: hypothetical protein AMXMBFR56_46240 [Polyangiaceae bacterium]